uniref:Uncharacterized protein n=1 Tax=Anguilla anguilla TaxID=7936 RepID=A0A0E9TZH7_ANGAN
MNAIAYLIYSLLSVKRMFEHSWDYK